MRSLLFQVMATIIYKKIIISTATHSYFFQLERLASVNAKCFKEIYSEFNGPGQRRTGSKAGQGSSIHHMEVIMFKIASFIKKFARDEKGVTYIEYGLIAALIAVVVVGMTGQIGDELLLKFTAILEGLQA